jgi:hypothetical protein
MTMRARKQFLVALFCGGLSLGLGAKPAIPEARFRVLYKATNEPVRWIAVQIYCQRKLKWSERHKTGEDEATVYDSFSFHPTEDGWVTLPAIEAPGTTRYDIEIYAPGCASLIYPCKGGLASPFNQENLPQFLRMPEDKRVLLAAYAPDHYWYVPIQQETYEGIQYSLDAMKAYCSEWPTLMSDVYGDTPPHGTWSEGEYKSRAPHYKENYFQEMLSWVHNMQENISHYERRVVRPFGGDTGGGKLDKAPISQEKLAELQAKAKELRARLRDIVCKDLQEKKQLWDSHKLLPALLNNPTLKRWARGLLEEWAKREEEAAKQTRKGFEPPTKFLDDPFVQEMDCEALREFYQHRNEAPTGPSGPAAVAPGVPSTGAQAQPPPGGSQQEVRGARSTGSHLAF